MEGRDRGKRCQGRDAEKRGMPKRPDGDAEKKGGRVSRLEHERKGEEKVNVRERLYTKGCQSGARSVER